MEKATYTDEQIKEIAINLYDFLMAESTKQREEIKKQKYSTTKSRIEMMAILPYLLDEFDIDTEMYVLDELCMPMIARPDATKVTFDEIQAVKEAVEKKLKTLEPGAIRKMIEEPVAKEKQ